MFGPRAERLFQPGEEAAKFGSGTVVALPAGSSPTAMLMLLIRLLVVVVR